MKTILFSIFMVVLVVLVLTPVGNAGDTRIEVTGTGIPGGEEGDIAIVQGAIEAVGVAGGGTVVLKGDFNFGSYGRVFITYDNVTLEGVIKGNKYNTSIIGGSFPILIGQNLPVVDHTVLDKNEIPFKDDHIGGTYPGNSDEIVPVKNVIVKDLHFGDPYFVGIGITGSNGDIKITGNKFTDARPVNDALGNDYMAKAILVGSGKGGDYTAYDPSVITGHILIQGNTIEGRYRMDPDDPDAKEVGDETGIYWLKGLDHGILIVGANVSTLIKDNLITGVGEHGIMVSNRFGGNISAEIEDNQIRNSYIGVPGIPTNWNLTESGIMVEGVSGTKISNNTINVAHPWSFGILTYGIPDHVHENMKILSNEVYTKDSELAISLGDFTYNSEVKNNKINGSANTGIWLGWPGTPNQFNTIMDNDMKDFKPKSGYDAFGIGISSGAHIALYWGASQNSIADNEYSAVDPDDNEIQNIFLADELELPDFTLPGTTDNVIREVCGLKVMDHTDPNGPLYTDPSIYAGDNDILLDCDNEDD